jgi:hypothetical protein
MLMNLMNMTLDVLTLLKDAGAVTSSAAAQVGGSGRILDLGASLSPTAGMQAAPLTPSMAVIDVAAISSGSDNVIRICIQASSSPTFASDVVNMGILDLSQGTNGLGGQTVVGAVGRYLVPILNWQNKVQRRYVRAFHVLSGTSPSVNYTCYLTKQAH